MWSSSSSLVKDGYKFQSETDTEVVAHLIDTYMKKGTLHLADAVRATAKEIRGSYAIAVISEREPGLLVAARSGCPLVIGRTANASFVASDVMAMLSHTRDVTYLEEGDVVEVTAGAVAIYGSRRADRSHARRRRSRGMRRRLKKAGIRTSC